MHFNTKYPPFEPGCFLDKSEIICTHRIPRENNPRHIEIYYDIKCNCGEIFNRRKDYVDMRLRNNALILCLPCSRIQKCFPIGKKILHLKIEKIIYENKRHWYICKCDCGKMVKKLKAEFHRNLDILLPKKFSCGCMNNYQQTGYKDISNSDITRWKKRHKNRFNNNPIFDLDGKFLWELYEKQNKRCAYTKMPIKLGFNRTAALDRIDNTKGYVKENVQWLHKRVNLMKSNLSEKEFMEICELIVKHFQTETPY